LVRSCHKEIGPILGSIHCFFCFFFSPLAPPGAFFSFFSFPPVLLSGLRPAVSGLFCVGRLSVRSFQVFCVTGSSFFGTGVGQVIPSPPTSLSSSFLISFELGDTVFSFRWAFPPIPRFCPFPFRFHAPVFFSHVRFFQQRHTPQPLGPEINFSQAPFPRRRAFSSLLFSRTNPPFFFFPNPLIHVFVCSGFFQVPSPVACHPSSLGLFF